MTRIISDDQNTSNWVMPDKISPPDQPKYSTLDTTVYSLIANVGSLIGFSDTKGFTAKLVDNLLPSHALTTSTYISNLKAYVDKTLNMHDIHHICHAAKILQDRSRVEGVTEKQEAEKTQYLTLYKNLPLDFQVILQKRADLLQILDKGDEKQILDKGRSLFQEWSEATDPDKSQELQDLYILTLRHIPTTKYEEFITPFIMRTLEKDNIHEIRQAGAILDSHLDKLNADNDVNYMLNDMENLRDNLVERLLDHEQRHVEKIPRSDELD